MKTSLFSVLMTGILFAACMAPAEKQYFTESPEIDVGKKLIEAYLAGDWDAYPGIYADTARIFSNASWATSEGFTVDEYVTSHKTTLEGTSSYDFDPQIWQSIVNDDGEHWVLFYGVWVGHNSATNKDYEIPVHVAMMVVDGKVAAHAEFFNNAEPTMDMMALQMEAAEGEEDHDDDE